MKLNIFGGSQDFKIKKSSVYTIYDVVSEEAGPLFTAKNELVAIRQTCSLFLSNPDINQEDYKLLKVAEFDSELPQLEIIPTETIDFGFVLADLKRTKIEQDIIAQEHKDKIIKVKKEA